MLTNYYHHHEYMKRYPSSEPFPVSAFLAIRNIILFPTQVEPSIFSSRTTLPLPPSHSSMSQKSFY